MIKLLLLTSFVAYVSAYDENPVISGVRTEEIVLTELSHTLSVSSYGVTQYNSTFEPMRKQLFKIGPVFRAYRYFIIGRREKKLIEELNQIKEEIKKLTSEQKTLSIQHKIFNQILSDGTGNIEEIKMELQRIEQKQQELIERMKQSEERQKLILKQLETLKEDITQIENKLTEFEKEFKEKAKEMENSFNMITSKLYDIEKELSDTKNAIIDAVLFDRYWAIRRPIIHVNEIYKEFLNSSSQNDYYEKEFNNACKEKNLKDTIQSINIYLTIENDIGHHNLIKSNDRYMFNKFTRIVIGDIVRAALIRVSCLGNQNAPSEVVNKEVDKMNEWMKEIKNWLQASDDILKNTFYQVANDELVKFVKAKAEENHTALAHGVQSMLQKKFYWMNWAAVTSISAGGRFYPSTDGLNGDSPYGMLFYTYSKKSGKNYDIAAYWTPKNEPKLIQNWQDQLRTPHPIFAYSVCCSPDERKHDDFIDCLHNSFQHLTKNITRNKISYYNANYILCEGEKGINNEENPLFTENATASEIDNMLYLNVPCNGYQKTCYSSISYHTAALTNAT